MSAAAGAVRTAARAAIRRASERARAEMARLDKRALAELERLYRAARGDLEAAIRLAADGPGDTIRLQSMRALLAQVGERLDQLAAARDAALSVHMTEAARLGVQPWALGGAAAGVATGPPAIGTDLARLADDAVRLARTFIAEDGLQLSDRLWRLDMGAKRRVGEAVQSAIVQGHGASEAAAEFLRRAEPVPPAVAAKQGAAGGERVARQVGEALMTGEGAPYDQARRVFRTEINRAHGEAYQAAAFEHEDVIGMRFLLSPAHPEPDICDLHARVNRYGLGPGVYPPGRSPWPAHPNTLSFQEPVFADEVTDADRAGREGRVEWLEQQRDARLALVLRSRAKVAALRSGLLTERQIATPWRVLRERYRRQGIDVDALARGETVSR